MPTLALKEIELDVELQPREDIDQELVATYAEAIEAGAEFPPVVVFKNGLAEHLLADGWHRFYAYQKAKRAEIDAEIREGDRMEALRYSLGANATHGRQRSELTVKRAYGKAIKHGLIEDPADRTAVRELLKIGERYARELTQDAYQAHLEATKSLALALAAKGWTQQKIADRLGVVKQTISNWLSNFGASAETGQDPDRLPARAELEAIAEEIDGAARAEVEPLLRKELRQDFEQELKDRIAKVKEQLEAVIRKERERAGAEREQRLAQKKRAEEEIAKLKTKLAETAKAISEARDEAARKAAEATAKKLTKDLETAQAKLAKERERLDRDRQEFERELEEAQEAATAAAEAPLGETEEEAEQRARVASIEAGNRIMAEVNGPDATAWFTVIKAIDAAMKIDQEELATARYQAFEERVLDDINDAIVKTRGRSRYSQEEPPVRSLRKTIFSAFNLFARSYHDADPTGKEFKKLAAKDYVRGRASPLREHIPASDRWQLEELEELAIAKLETAPLRLNGDVSDPDALATPQDQMSFLDKIGECYIDDDGRAVQRAPGRLTYSQYQRRLKYLVAQRALMDAGIEKEQKLFEDNRKRWKKNPELTLNEILGREIDDRAA